jgi:hypothetical protein
MKKDSLLRLFLLPVYKPVEGMRDLKANPRKVVRSLVIFLFLGGIYTLSVQMAWSRGLGAEVEPFVRIPAEDYYYWQRFWQIPFFFLTTILFAGTVRLLAVSVKGRGNFIDLFCLFCVAQTFPMFLTMWVPETIGFVFFPGQSIFPVWVDAARQIIGILWPLLLTIIGITIIEDIKWPYSLAFTLIAAVPVTGLMIIFIR